MSPPTYLFVSSFTEKVLADLEACITGRWNSRESEEENDVSQPPSPIHCCWGCSMKLTVHL